MGTFCCCLDRNLGYFSKQDCQKRNKKTKFAYIFANLWSKEIPKNRFESTNNVKFTSQSISKKK